LRLAGQSERAGGIDLPAAVVSKLELNGHAIGRVYTTGAWVTCASSAQTPGSAPAQRRRRRLWQHR
jgi:hypothetical protein